MAESGKNNVMALANHSIGGAVPDASFAHLNQSQIEMLIVSVHYLSCALHHSDDFARTIYEVDDIFDNMFAFHNPINKAKLIYDREQYVEQLFKPLTEQLMRMQESEAAAHV
ncbi:MAG: hypothetical protein CTY10_06340 [Methylotenera sp.]|nr:MAG: hypothetical protein CTY10_06340 [Methylotenera sp.]